VIIAGSSGSVAATAGLMEAILGRPQSALVLYGFDDTRSAESFAAASAHPEHPQHGLQQLLARLDIQLEGRRAVPALAERQEPRPRRAKFLRMALRPAPATVEWAPFIESMKDQAGSPAPGLSFIEAATVQDEAAAIALILREALETPGRTAALVTPNESL